MTTNEKIGDWKIQQGMIGQAARVLALWLANFDKNECLTREEILSPNRGQITQQTKSAYSPLE